MPAVYRDDCHLGRLPADMVMAKIIWNSEACDYLHSYSPDDMSDGEGQFGDEDTQVSSTQEVEDISNERGRDVSMETSEEGPDVSGENAGVSGEGQGHTQRPYCRDQPAGDNQDEVRFIPAGYEDSDADEFDGFYLE